MKNKKEIFKALETVAIATGKEQELKFGVEGFKETFTYTVHLYGSAPDFETFASVKKWNSNIENYTEGSMNVDRITDSSIFLYDYTMLSKRILDKIALSSIQIIND